MTTPLDLYDAELDRFLATLKLSPRDHDTVLDALACHLDAVAKLGALARDASNANVSKWLIRKG